MSLRVIWQYMDRSVTKKILYDLRSFSPYNIFLVTDRSIYCHMTLSAMNYLLYITLYVFIFPIWSLFSYMDRPGICIIILDKKYNIANSSCHFRSYGSIWTGPSPKTYYMGLVHILPYDPQCHELFAIYRCRNKLTYNKAANLQKSIHFFLPTN